jgi:hypothetical protein
MPRPDPVIHDFATDLKFSQDCADYPFWGDLYRRAFPDLATMLNVREDGFAQRGGVDRVLLLKSSHKVNVDEKVRKIYYPDIALERWSDRRRQTPGWVQKHLDCDFIAYAKLPHQIAFLLPTLLLQRAWRLEGRDWIYKAERNQDGFSIALALNKGYVTESVCVPDKVLEFAIAHCAMRVSWQAGAPPPDREQTQKFREQLQLPGILA